MSEHSRVNVTEIKRFNSKILALQGQGPREHWAFNAKDAHHVVENTTVAESEITLPPHIGRLMAGLLEAGGHMGINVSYGTEEAGMDDRRKARTRVRPVVSHSDTRPEKLRMLQSLFGGSFLPERRPNKKNSINWQVRDNGALEIADLIEPYAISRTNIIAAFRNYEAAATLEEQIDIANAARGRHEFAGVTIDDYAEAASEPAFLAGVFESRAAINYSEFGSELVRFGSKNESLLKAVQRENGGSDVRKAEQNRYILDLAVNDSARFLAKVEPYLITPLSAYRKL